MNFVNAELTKISVNTYVTTKISYANMLAEMCDRLPGADVDVVATAVGSDSRVGSKYIKGAIGYGGPCFPRDNKAFAALGRKIGARCDLAEATDRINDHQIDRLVSAVKAHAQSDSRITVLGLSYKPETGVVEESQGVGLAQRLSAEGFVVNVYDPIAMPGAEAVLGDRVMFASDLDHALAEAEIVVVATPWSQFKGKALFASQRNAKLVIIDPWRVTSEEAVPDRVSVIRMGFGSDTRQPTDVLPLRRASA
jgi:UDPglucose 6-dehydrogenase